MALSQAFEWVLGILDTRYYFKRIERIQVLGVVLFKII